MLNYDGKATDDAVDEKRGSVRPWWPFTNEQDYREFQEELRRGDPIVVEFVSQEGG